MSSLGTGNFMQKLKPDAEKLKNLIGILKTAAILLIVICMVGLMFSGCGGESSAGSGKLSAGSGINAPIVMNYTVNNPLNFEDIQEGDGNSFNYHYIKISGLLDKEAEQAVNDRIKAVYDELRIQDIPPYRGIKATIPEGSTVQSESIAPMLPEISTTFSQSSSQNIPHTSLPVRRDLRKTRNITMKADFFPKPRP